MGCWWILKIGHKTNSSLKCTFDTVYWYCFRCVRNGKLLHLAWQHFRSKISTIVCCSFTDQCMYRIQQIQLLGRGMKGPEHDKLWNQLEAEIHLHRHKTVVRACRGRVSHHCQLPAPQGHVSEIGSVHRDTCSFNGLFPGFLGLDLPCVTPPAGQPTSESQGLAD